ncbi:MAG: hypothetical protein ACREUC_02705 [Steroidobacteraceae bacterium]
MNRIRCGAVVLAGMWSTFSFADAAGDTLPPSLRACMGERDDARRLSCFDRETARLTQPEATTARASEAPATPAPSSAAASAPAPKAAPATPAISDEEKFGYRGGLAREEVDRRKAEEEKLDQVTAKVAELSALPHGQFVATLDNGQIWQQKLIDRSVRLKIGDEVTIRRASFGSFMLVTASGKSTRVARVE